MSEPKRKQPTTLGGEPQAQIYGLWLEGSQWFVNASGEVFWAEHRCVAEAQRIHANKLFGIRDDDGWQVRVIGDNGMPG